MNKEKTGNSQTDLHPEVIGAGGGLQMDKTTKNSIFRYELSILLSFCPFVHVDDEHLRNPLRASPDREEEKRKVAPPHSSSL